MPFVPPDNDPRADDRMAPEESRSASLPPVSLDPRRRQAIGDRLEALARRRRNRRLLLGGGVSLAVAAAGIVLVLGTRAERGPTLAGGSRVLTGSGDFQVLPLGERALAFVGEHSELIVPAEGSGSDGAPAPALQLRRGTVRLIVKRQPDRPFVVATSAADVTVLGTEFDVTVNGDVTDVKVVRGAVEVKNPHGRQRLWAREQARASAGEAPRMVVPVRGLVTEESPEIIEKPATRPASR